VVAALQRAQVDTVLMADDPSSTDTLWIGPDSPPPSEPIRSNCGLPGSTSRCGCALTALLRAIVGTDAGSCWWAHEVPLEHGTVRCFRYADASTRTV
jgi:hypothetical protein